MLAARRLGFDARSATLAGGAVAICGASAAMALATMLGERRASQAQLTLVLVGISAMSAAAMVLYPLAAHALALSDLRAGFLLGASIHDVAQALGAGYSYSDAAGQIAAIVKLTRVALLAPVLAIVALFLPGERGAASGCRGSWSASSCWPGSIRSASSRCGRAWRGSGGDRAARRRGDRHRDPLAARRFAGGGAATASGDPGGDAGRVCAGAGGG